MKRRPLTRAIFRTAFLAALAAFFFAAFPHAARAGFDDQFTVTDDIGEAKVPHFGTSNVLIIPVIVRTEKQPDLARWNAFFNNKEGAFTFSAFWAENSLGRFTVRARFIEPIYYDACPLPAEFKGCGIKRGDVNALNPGIKLLIDILKRAADERGVRFRDFDTNGPDEAPDGWDDGVMVLTNIDFGGIAFPLSLVRKTAIDGVKIGGVAVAGIDEPEVTAIHEFGHLLGFGDLYHENLSNRGLYLSLMGEYTKQPPLLDAFSRMKIGWADVVELGPGIHKLRIPPVDITGRVYKIGHGKEYFLIENRRPGKFFDTRFKSSGLAVYHVDEGKYPPPGRYAFIQSLQHCLNCDTWHPLIMNVPSDGRFDIQTGKKFEIDELLFRTGDSLLPGYGAQNPISEALHPLNSNWYSGEPSDFALRNIDSDNHLPVITAEIEVR